jgi:hypothetical protein
VENKDIIDVFTGSSEAFIAIFCGLLGFDNVISQFSGICGPSQLNKIYTKTPTDLG